jgi:CO/xanthine dehydrogenase FAD-binding subunit
MLVEAAALSGAIAIQNRGTLGGNVVNASPAADSPPALLAYDAELELVSTTGTRRVPYARFHTGYKTMDRRPDELVRTIRMPRKPGGERAVHAYRKVGTRKAQAIAKVGLAALGRVDDGKVVHIRLAFSSVAPIPLRAEKTEATMVGQRPTDETIATIDDVRSTAMYRARVAQNLVEDVLRSLA